MPERLASDIAADLRGQRAGLVINHRLLVEAADKLDSLITSLAEVERERDEARKRQCTALCRDVEEDRDKLSDELAKACKEVEWMRPVVEAAKALREAASASAYLGAPSELVDLIAGVDALESGDAKDLGGSLSQSGVDPALGQVTEEQVPSKPSAGVEPVDEETKRA